jgi:tetratricopeptide (TPR) repeat protein
MTSRIVENSKHSTVPSEALEGLDLTLSAQLVLKAAHVPMEAWSTETKEAENVAELLGSHTLALVQAGAYIAGGHCRLNQYAERYRRHRKQLLQHHPNQHQLRYQNVLTTFEASVHAMHGLKSEAGMDALDLLRIFAMVHHTNFPRQLFYDAWVGAWAISHGEAQTTNTPHQQAGSQHTQRLLSIWKKSKRGIRLSKLLVRPKSYDIRALGSEHLSQLPSLLGHELVSWKYWNHRHVDDATALLVSLSLMERHEFDGDIRWSIHPIVHTWAKDRLQQSEKKHAWLQAACLCACSLVKSDIWKVQRMALRPHVRSLVSPGAEELFLYGPRALMLPLIVHCAWLLSAVGEFRALQTLLEGTYQAIGISPWSLAEEYMPLWHLASTASVVLSQPKLPIHLLQHITSVEAITLSESNPQRLSSQYNLARAYNDNGQPESAIPLLEHIVPLYKTLSTHQEWLVASQIELTRAYTATNRHYESMSLLEDAVKVQESYTGPSAQHCLVRAQAALGKAYVANGRISDAIDLLEHVMTINESMVDEPIQERLAIMTTLGCAYYEKDQYDKAVALLRNVEQDQKETLEDSDPYLVETQYTLATTYLVCGQAAEAVRIYEHVVKMHEIIMKETQPERLSAIYGLARAYKDIGEEDKALELMQRVVVLKRKTADEHDQVRVSSERFLKAWMEERELERLEEMVV